jgi:hypothetical protein
MLIVEAFSRLFINGGGQSDGYGYYGGNCYGYGCGYDFNDDDGDGYGEGYGGGYGDSNGGGYGTSSNKCPEEWRAPP